MQSVSRLGILLQVGDGGVGAVQSQAVVWSNDARRSRGAAQRAQHEGEDAVVVMEDDGGESVVRLCICRSKSAGRVIGPSAGECSSTTLLLLHALQTGPGRTTTLRNGSRVQSATSSPTRHLAVELHRRRSLLRCLTSRSGSSSFEHLPAPTPRAHHRRTYPPGIEPPPCALRIDTSRSMH